MPRPDRWSARLRTAKAMLVLSWARLVIAALPFSWWRNRLGGTSRQASDTLSARVRGIAADVEWAARRLPYATKCLPRAMALSWILRSNRIGHVVVMAVRPIEHRNSADALHAWVEIGGEKVLGDLPGPWIETIRIPA